MGQLHLKPRAFGSSDPVCAFKKISNLDTSTDPPASQGP